MSAHKQRWPALQSLPHIRQPVPIDRMSGEYGTTNEQSTQPRTDHYKWHKRSCGKARRLMMENNVLCDMPCRMWKREESLRPIQSHSLSSSVHQGPRGFWYINKNNDRHQRHAHRLPCQLVKPWFREVVQRTTIYPSITTKHRYRCVKTIVATEAILQSNSIV